MSTTPHQASSTQSTRSEMASRARTMPSLSGQLTLCILTPLIGVYPQPSAHIQNYKAARASLTPNPATLCTLTPGSPTRDKYTYLLMGSRDDFCCYSREENSQWLINIAHDICDPRLKRGLLQRWSLMEKVWKNVSPTDTLMASHYRYHVEPGIVLALTKMNKRDGRSKTSTTDNPKPSKMALEVKNRDQNRCWISSLGFPLVNSHICPKRMGDHLFQAIYCDFVLPPPRPPSPPLPPPPSLSIYDKICGITLFRGPDPLFVIYQLGLRYVSPDVYECHVFLPPDWPANLYCTTHGGAWGTPGSQPLLHGYRTGPPPGLFRWHYLRCVIRKFAHSDYKHLQNIFYLELPLRMEEDSDDEGTDSEFEWPSAVLDRGRAEEVAIKEHVDQQIHVAEWVSKR